MASLVASLLLVLAPSVVAEATNAGAPTTPGAPTTSSTPTSAPPPAAVDDEARELTVLRAFEAKLAVGSALTDAETTTLTGFVAGASSARARALAAAVLPWLDPAVAVGPLVRGAADSDPRVRATVAQSLLALARRMPVEQAPAVLGVATALLDDVASEVACAGAELLTALDAPGARAAFEARAAAADDVRYACFVRFGGLPVRVVQMPALPAVAPAPSPPGQTSPGASTVPAAPAVQWIALATAAGAGVLAGAALPAALVPSRDVLLYDDRRSKLSREEVSGLTQAGAGLVAGALLGGGAWAAEQAFGRLTDTEALAFAGATGAGATLGAGLGFVFGGGGGGQALALSLGTLSGVAAGAAVAWGAAPSDDDNALLLASAATGALATSLGAFALVPVGVDDVFGATRTDFGLGAGLAGAGLFGLAATIAAPFVELSAPRLAAITAGGLVGGGALTALGFLVVPRDLNVRSRIACGMGLAGQVTGAVLAGLLVPDAWLTGTTTVAVAGHAVQVGVPALASFAPLPGTSDAPLGAVVTGRF